MRILYARKGRPREGDLSLFSCARIPPGHRSGDGGQAAHHARLEQLPRPDRQRRDRRSGPRGALPLRNGLLRLPLPQRDAPSSPGTRRGTREVPPQGSGLHLQHRLPVQPRHHLRDRRPPRRDPLRQGEPRVDLRRLYALVRQDGPLQPQRYEGPREEARCRPQEGRLPDRHGRRLLDGRRYREPAGDLPARETVRRARDGRRCPRPRRDR